MTKTIYLGADHAGFKLKEKICLWLDKQKILHQDLGNYLYEPEDDYPDFAEKVAKKTVKNRSFGILICGSAEGVCIAANKIKGALAVNPHNLKLAKLARQHNAANIICLSGWYTNFPKAKRLIKVFLKTKFSTAKRHTRRINKIKKLEK